MTVRLSPVNSGPAKLVVRSIDRAGNRSGIVEYDFFVRDGGQPTITVVGEQPSWGGEVTLRLSPAEDVHGVVEYTYQVNSAEPRTVAAGADGTATFSFQTTGESGEQVEVWSRSANGFISQKARWAVFYDPWPTVSSDIYKGFEPTGGVGVPGTFTFTPPTDRVGAQTASYRYTFDGEEPVTIPAGADRTATVTWTPTVSGFRSLTVVAIAADGTESYEGFHDFNVA